MEHERVPTFVELFADKFGYSAVSVGLGDSAMVLLIGGVLVGELLLYFLVVARCGQHAVRGRCQEVVDIGVHIAEFGDFLPLFFANCTQLGVEYIGKWRQE